MLGSILTIMEPSRFYANHSSFRRIQLGVMLKKCPRSSKYLNVSRWVFLFNSPKVVK